MNIWMSSGAFKTSNLSEMLQTAKTLGLSNIELSSGLSHDPAAVELARHAAQDGFFRFMVHNYFPAPAAPFVLNIASLDPDGLMQSRAFAEAAIALADEFQAPYYSIHAGFAAALKPEHLGQPGRLASMLKPADIDREAAYEVMIETIRHLAECAAKRGMDLLIENNVISPLFLERMSINPLLLTEGEEISAFFNDLQRDNVGLLLDLAHARVSASACSFSVYDMIEQVAPFVRCLHLSDNDGREDSNQPVSPETWFLPLLKGFPHCDFVIEAYNLEPEQMQQQLNLVQQHLV